MISYPWWLDHLTLYFFLLFPISLFYMIWASKLDTTCYTSVLFLLPLALPALCSPVGNCCWNWCIPVKWHFNPDIPTTLCCFLNWHLHGRWRKWPSKYILGHCERTARLMAVLAVCLQADTRLEITQRLNFSDQLVGFLFLPCYRRSVEQVKMVWLASL